MYKFYFFIIINLTVFGCKKNETKNSKLLGEIASVNFKDKITKVNHKPIEIKIDLSEIIEGEFDDYFSLKKIIYLDNKSPIGEISIIRQYNDKLYILDKNNVQQLFCFDLKGRLIWKFDSKGRGPLEYGKISDFVINTKSNTIDVLDKKRYKIIKLDMDTGMAKTEFNLGCYATEMILYNDREYLLYTNSKTIINDFDYKLLLVSTDKKVLSRNLPFSDDERKKRWRGFRSLERYKKTIFFTESINDTIYTIKNDTLKTAYYVNFLDKKYPKELLSNFTFERAQKLDKANPYIPLIDRVRQRNDLLNFTFTYKKRSYCAFYDIDKQLTYVFKKLKKGKMPGDFQQICPQGYIDDGFISYIDPFVLNKDKELMESNKDYEEYLKKNKKEMYNVLLNINEYSNPVLFVYEFKKNN